MNWMRVNKWSLNSGEKDAFGVGGSDVQEVGQLSVQKVALPLKEQVQRPGSRPMC